MARIGLQKETATQDWKNKMLTAKSDLPTGIGQQDVILKVIEFDPGVDSLANSTRWRNAWFCKVSDPHLTGLVERAAAFFREQNTEKNSRIRRQKLSGVRK